MSCCSHLGKVLGTTAFAASALVVSAAQATSCSLGALPAVPGMTYTSATLSTPGTTPAHCRVVGVVASATTNPHGDGFALDLPASWNGRFLMGGGGGFAGSLNGPNITALTAGYAVGTTDTGHTGGNLNFALIAPGVRADGPVADYFYLAMHTVTEASKQFIKAFYASSIKYSYFQGCSTGGRQALVEAERYPDDFDGIIAGDAFMTHRLVLQQLKGEFDILRPSSAYISSTQLPGIDAAVYANCDAKDGTTDNLIQNPQACSFDPRTVVCGMHGAPTTGCLTQVQADALSDYIRPITESGKEVIAGYPYSDLGGPDGMALWFLGSTPNNFPGPEPWLPPLSPPFSWGFADNTLKYLVYLDPNYNTFNFKLANDGTIDPASLKLYDQMTEAGNADDPTKLLPYLHKGKKLLIYHGFSDGGLSSFPMINFYKDLAGMMDGYGHLQRNARLFLVPGMHHCGGGPGPNVFDTLTPLQQWVENGTEPDGILATHFTSPPPPATPMPDRTMPLCKFPEQARYSGKGDVNNAANWSCPKGDKSLLKVGPNGVEAGLGGRSEDDDRSDD